MACGRLALALFLVASVSINAAWLIHYAAFERQTYHQRDTASGVTLSLHHAPVVESRVTPYQRIEIRRSPFFGTVLVIDDDLMLTSRDEASYHEMATHVPLAFLPDAEEVVIIGGGDGGVCAQVLQHPGVRRITMVEIDAEVVDVAARHFPQFSHCFADPRVSLVFQDGAQWARSAVAQGRSSSVDVVIVDSTDFNQAESLFTVAFYRDIRTLLTPTGVVVSNLSSLSWNLRGCGRAVRRQRRVFNIVVPYQVFQPTYMSGHYGYLFCSMATNPLVAEVDWSVFTAKGVHTQYYTPAVHWAAFALPPFVKDALPPFFDGDVGAAELVQSMDPPARYPFGPAPLTAAPHDAAAVVGSRGDVGDAPSARVGTHVLAELVGVAPALLNNESFVREAMLGSAAASALTVVSEHFHSFSPHGVTGILLLSESHMSVHTWPELGYAAVDVFTCGSSTGSTVPAPHMAVTLLQQAFGAAQCHTKTVARGYGFSGATDATPVEGFT